MLAANAVELLSRIRPGDVVLLHDPQTAGLAAPLLRAGAQVVWRCHIGVGWDNDATRAGWNFLRPHLTSAQAYVFSRRDYVPTWLPDEKVSIIRRRSTRSPLKTSSSTPPPCKPSSRTSVCSTVPYQKCPRDSSAATAMWTPSPGQRPSLAKAARPG